MFTGIIEEIGKVLSLRKVGEGWELTIEAEKVVDGARLGDSVAVEGTCLTITEMVEGGFIVGLAPETLARTHLGELESSDPINLERSLAVDGRFDGHFVQGHVDGTGTICRLTREEDSLWVEIEAPPEILRYLVPKGYVAVDGVSLTVVEVGDASFTFMLVAYTQRHISLPQKQVGDRVNLEVDILGKYIEKLIGGQSHAFSQY